MKRPHQRWHLALWLVLAPLVVVVVIVALVQRPPQPTADSPRTVIREFDR